MKLFKILLLFVSQIVFAQNYLEDLSFEYLTINEGLSQNTVLSIVQDSVGYIWFGTRDGLNRYDGYSFKQYFSDFSDSNSLSSNEITSLDVAPNGILWIGTTDGLNAYNPSTGKIQPFQLHPNPIVNNYINVITHNAKGEMFIGDAKGITIIGVNGKIASHKINDTEGAVTSIVEDSKGNLWVGGIQSLTKYDRGENKFRVVELIPDSPDISSSISVRGLLLFSDNELWVGTTNGIIKYDINNNLVLENLQSQIYFNPSIRMYLRSMIKDKSGNVWFAEWDGLRIYDKQSEECLYYSRSDENGALNSNAVNSILEDKSGVFWIGTSFGGVNYFDPTKKKFSSINRKSGLSNSIVSSISEDVNGNLWVGTIGGGLNKIDRKTDKIKVLNESNSKLKNDLIRVTTIKGDDLWIGDWGNNLTHYSISTAKMEVINLADLGFELKQGNAIKDIEIDSDDNLWVATSRNGVFRFLKNGDVKNYSANFPNCIGDDRVREIFFDKNNNLWLLVAKGLSRYNEKTDSFECIDFNKDKCMTKTKMISVYVDDNNIFWVGTYGNGLLKIDIVKKECFNYKANKNIPNNVVYSVLPDSLGYLWISTNNGIARFYPKTETSSNFNIDDGLQGNEFNDNAFCKTSDGKLVFGGISGLNIINPNLINTNNYIPPIVITNIEFLNSKELNRNYLEKIKDNTLTLEYFETDFNVEFSALNYSQPQKNKYAYKLEPANKDWIYLANRRTITFTNLKHGTYTLRIKGSNNDGVWNEQGAKLKIVVLPPFWVTWWFVLIISLLVISIVVSLIYFKVQSILRVERIRTKIASDLHDDVGASLTKISMNASLLGYETESNKISKRIVTLNNLSQEVISMMSDIVWSIDARNDTVQNMVDRMKNFAFNHVSEKEIDVDFIADSSINDEKLKINVRQNIYLIFKEAFHNAVKYSNSNKIEVIFSASKQKIYLKIVDNGIGMNLTTNHLGNGVRNMKMRAEKIKAKIQFVNENGLTIILETNKF